jgi:hypothetical protein
MADSKEKRNIDQSLEIENVLDRKEKKKEKRRERQHS